MTEASPGSDVIPKGGDRDVHFQNFVLVKGLSALVDTNTIYTHVSLVDSNTIYIHNVLLYTKKQ